MTNKELAAIVAAQAEQVEKLTAALASAQAAPADAKRKTERKLKVQTAREWTGSNTMLATYRDYGNGKPKRGARLYRAELDAILSEFGIKLNAEQRENVDTFYAPMAQD